MVNFAHGKEVRGYEKQFTGIRLSVLPNHSKSPKLNSIASLQSVLDAVLVFV